MAAYSLIPTHHGDHEIHDLGGEVAIIRYDPCEAGWAILANDRRYPTQADLPAVFGGRCTDTVPRFGDVHRFFGLPLPGDAVSDPPVSEPDAAAA